MIYMLILYPQNLVSPYSVKGTSTVSTLDSTSLLVGVNVGQGTSGSLDDFDAVAASGIGVLATVGETLDHVFSGVI